MELTPGAARAVERLERTGKSLKTLTRAQVLDDAAWLCRMEDTMPGQTGVFAKASADAMELYDLMAKEG